MADSHVDPKLHCISDTRNRLLLELCTIMGQSRSPHIREKPPSLEPSSTPSLGRVRQSLIFVAPPVCSFCTFSSPFIMRHSIAYAAIGLLASIASASPCTVCDKHSVQNLLEVETGNGQVKGHLVNDHPCVVEYLGIPYAQPPLGDLRFAAPEPYSGNKLYDAAGYSPDCPLTASPPVDFPGFFDDAQRIIAFFASGAGTPQSEDCLTLNVWSRATKRADEGSKPILIHFYGGRKDFPHQWAKAMAAD